MDPTTFDALLRRVARQTTRRAALATLLGGALLLHDPAASDATKEAQRLKHRRRKQRRRQARNPFLKPISVRVHNPGPNSVTLQHGYFREGFAHYYCTQINRIPIPPGENRLFQSPSRPNEHLWINDRYWIIFLNRAEFKPLLSAAVDGTNLTSRFRGCPPRGTTVLDSKEMSVSGSVNITMDGHVFSVTRNRDTNYKEFTLTLPAEL